MNLLFPFKVLLRVNLSLSHSTIVILTSQELKANFRHWKHYLMSKIWRQFALIEQVFVRTYADEKKWIFINVLFGSCKFRKINLAIRQLFVSFEKPPAENTQKSSFAAKTKSTFVRNEVWSVVLSRVKLNISYSLKFVWYFLRISLDSSIYENTSSLRTTFEARKANSPPIEVSFWSNSLYCLRCVSHNVS